MRAMKYVFTVVIGVALLGLCFYGGRVYQSNTDQKLFAAYAPPTPGGGGSGNGPASFGGGAGASGAGLGGGTSNSQVQAALAVGTPPPQPTLNPGAGAVSLPQGGSAGAAPRGLSGQLASIAGGTLTVQSFQGPQSVATTARTGYYRVEAATAAALTAGQAVAVAVISGTTQARSVTVVPTGGPFISVRAFGGAGGSGGAAGASGTGGSSGSGGFGSGGSAGGGSGSGSSGGGFGSGGSSGSGGSGGFGSTGGSGSAGGSSSGGSGGYGGAGGVGGYGARAGRAAVTGTITAAHSGSLTIETAQGTSRTITLSSSTAVYRATKATKAQLTTGSYVSILPSTANGQTVAVAVAQASGSGAIATFVQ